MMNSQSVASDPSAPASAVTTFPSTSTQRSNSVDSIQGIDNILSGFGFFLELSLAPNQTPPERNALVPQGTVISFPFLFRFSSNAFLAAGLSFVGLSASAGTRHRLGMLGSPTKMTFTSEESRTEFEDQDYGSVVPSRNEPIISTPPLSVESSTKAEHLSPITVAESRGNLDLLPSAIWGTTVDELEVLKIELQKTKAALKVAIMAESVMFSAYIEALCPEGDSPPSSPCSQVTTIIKQQPQSIAPIGHLNTKFIPTTAAIPPSPGSNEIIPSYFPFFVEIAPYNPERLDWATYPLEPAFYSAGFRAPDFRTEVMMHIVCMDSYAMWSPEELRLIFYQQIQQLKQRTDSWSTKTTQAHFLPTRARLVWERPCSLSMPSETRLPAGAPPTSDASFPFTGISSSTNSSSNAYRQHLVKEGRQEATWGNTNNIQGNTIAQFTANTASKAASLDELNNSQAYVDARDKAQESWGNDDEDDEEDEEDGEEEEEEEEEDEEDS